MSFEAEMVRRMYPDLAPGQSPEGMIAGDSNKYGLRQEAGYGPTTWGALTEGGNIALTDGYMFQGGGKPVADPDGTYGGVKGTWMYQGNVNNGTGMVQDWVFQTEKPREAAPLQAEQPLQRVDDPAPEGPTIYDGWDDYIAIARAEDQGRNRMPFVGPNWSEGNKTYGDTPYDPLLSLEMYYPSGKGQNDWREKRKDPFEGGLLKDKLLGGGGMR